MFWRTYAEFKWPGYPWDTFYVNGLWAKYIPHRSTGRLLIMENDDIYGWTFITFDRSQLDTMHNLAGNTFIDHSYHH